MKDQTIIITSPEGYARIKASIQVIRPELISLNWEGQERIDMGHYFISMPRGYGPGEWNAQAYEDGKINADGTPKQAEPCELEIRGNGKAVKLRLKETDAATVAELFQAVPAPATMQPSPLDRLLENIVKRADAHKAAIDDCAVKMEEMAGQIQILSSQIIDLARLALCRSAEYAEPLRRPTEADVLRAARNRLDDLLNRSITP